jgi:hypothetical protein
MRTAFLGAYGYGNLGDELCLIEAMRAFPSAECFAFTQDPDWTMRCAPGLAGTFFEESGLLARRPARIVMGGGFIGEAVYMRTNLPAMAAAQRQGALTHIHNIGASRMGRAADWAPDGGVEAIRRLASFTVRDPRSAEMVLEWDVGLIPGLTRYPEKSVPADPSLADALLPAGVPLLGVSVTHSARMWRCLEHGAARVRALLDRFPDHALVPVVSTIHRLSEEERDDEGFRRFHASFCPGRPVVAPELAEPGFWRAELTPQRLKGVVARLDVLVTQRKHNAIHAIGSGVPVIGIHIARDDSLPRTFQALAESLAGGSACHPFPDPP